MYHLLLKMLPTKLHRERRRVYVRPLINALSLNAFPLINAYPDQTVWRKIVPMVFHSTFYQTNR